MIIQFLDLFKDQTITKQARYYQFREIKMLSEYAYAKLQSMEGQEYFIHTIPALLSSRKCKDHDLGRQSQIEWMPITSIFNTFIHHAIIYHSGQDYCIIPITPISVDKNNVQSNETLITKLSGAGKGQIDKFIQHAIANSENYQTFSLKQLSRIMIMGDSPEAFSFCLPVTGMKKNKKIMAVPNQILPTNNASSSSTKWSNDDHQQLKKLLLSYGYDRWNSIQRSSATMGGKLDQKPLSQVKAYSNGYFRALGLALPEEETNLKFFLQKIIQENDREFQEYQPNIKDWDQHIQLPQRAVQYTKRLQLLYRVKNLIRKYREDSLKNMTVKDRKKISWDGLLNFIPLGLLFGQRPAVWWAKKHDIDLLLGVYKYGYANYVAIRAAKQYCFAQLQKSHAYQDFPVADNLTRRLKKLINTIIKIQQNQGEIDFDQEAESQEDEKLWTDVEKKALFNILTEYGVPVGADNKSNWVQLKERLKNQVKDFSKSPAQVEKMVSRIRWNCQEILSDEKLKEQANNNSMNTPFKINYEQAFKFIKNINILEFIRKSILSIEEENLKTFFKQIEERNPTLTPDHLAYIEGNSKSDQQLLKHVDKHGLIAFNPLKLSEARVFARIQWFCEIFKIVKQKLQNNNKKKPKTFDQSTKKKPKFEISRDKDGNIKFPISINPSLTLQAIGRISTLPNYHSEHNLFPIGYKSVRTHASMFHKGQRAKYRCEILQGDNRPIYKVTPQEDPTNSIIKDSSTGCWVYICQRVNNLQDVKKEKVTISGTQRFGLLQPNVVRLLEDLFEAEKCMKYKFKKNLPKETD